MISVGKQPVSFDQIKIENVETGIYKNDQLVAAVRHTPGKAQALSGCPSLAWCCSPLTPKHVCAVFCFFLC